jgi:hypothetical protein
MIIIDWTREEGLVMESDLITRTRSSAPRELGLPSCWPMPTAHAAQMITTPILASMGTQHVQGGRSAGFGEYDVTDTKFSTLVGRPPCSPPV